MIFFSIFSDDKQIDVKNNKFFSNTEMINQFQHEDLNVINSDLELKSYETKSSRNYPRIIENKQCKINIAVLSNSMESSANSSLNISMLKKSLQLSEINVSDAKSSTNCSTNLINDNSKEVIKNDEIVENKFMFTSNNNDESCYNDPQFANVSQKTGMYI